MPAEPASITVGACTSRKSLQPSSQHIAPTHTASAMLVPITLRRIRGRALRATIRGPISSAKIGPSPNMMSGLRNSAVAEPRPRRERAVLGDGQRAHIAASSTVEVSGGRVVDRMVMAPAQERRVDEQSKHHSEPRVGASGRQERAVRAVMEDDERSHEEPARWESRARARADRRPEAPCTSPPTARDTARPRLPDPRGFAPDGASHRERAPRASPAAANAPSSTVPGFRRRRETDRRHAVISRGTAERRPAKFSLSDTASPPTGPRHRWQLRSAWQVARSAATARRWSRPLGARSSA